MLVDLRDGTRIHIRPVRPDDKRLLARGLERLSEESRRRRFLAAKPRLSPSELRYLTEVDGHDHIALVAVLADEPATLVGVARSVRLPEDPDTAEMAIVVGDEWQGRGLGTILAEVLADAAADTGIRRIAATMLGDNHAARRLVSQIAGHLAGGGRAVIHDDGVHRGVRELTVEVAA